MTARVTLRNPDKGVGKGILSFYAEAWNTDKQHKTPVQTVEVDWTKPEQELELALGDKALLWSEFTPALYRLSVSLKTDQSVDTEQATFGLRDFKTKGRQFTMKIRAVIISNSKTELSGKRLNNSSINSTILKGSKLKIFRISPLLIRQHSFIRYNPLAPLSIIRCKSRNTQRRTKHQSRDKGGEALQ